MNKNTTFLNSNNMNWCKSFLIKRVDNVEYINCKLVLPFQVFLLEFTRRNHLLDVSQIYFFQLQKISLRTKLLFIWWCWAFAMLSSLKSQNFKTNFIDSGKLLILPSALKIKNCNFHRIRLTHLPSFPVQIRFE